MLGYRRSAADEVGKDVVALAVILAVPLYAIEFYRGDPELRHEFGTDKGVERIRNGDLPDVLLEVCNNERFLPATNAAE